MTERVATPVAPAATANTSIFGEKGTCMRIGGHAYDVSSISWGGIFAPNMDHEATGFSKEFVKLGGGQIIQPTYTSICSKYRAEERADLFFMSESRKKRTETE